MKLILVILSFWLCNLSACQKPEKSLVLVHVLVRHGHRTADLEHSFPTNPLRVHKFYPYGPGELNLEGKINMSQVGVALKKRYVDFLGDVYYDSLIEAISSEYKRTMMSLQAVLASLFRPSTSRLKGDLNWQPVPFKYIPFKKDNLLATYVPCPDVLQLQTDVDEETQKLYTFLTKHSGLNITSSQELFTVYHSLRSLFELNLEIPDWVKHIWPQPIKEASKQFWQDIVNQKLKKSAGSLLKKIHEDSRRKIDGSYEPKMVIYSGHDINIVSLIGVFNLFKKENINYGSYVIIELHKIKEHHYVKIIYENYNLSEPQVMQIPGCSKFCEFEKFVAITEKFYPNKNWCS